MLWIDWGSKYIGLAYYQTASKVILPIGYVSNDWSVFFNLADAIARYAITQIIIGYPNQSEEVQVKIESFAQQLGMIIGEWIKVDFLSEDYTSVEAATTNTNGEYSNDKNSNDTLAAMKILERWVKEQESA